MAILKKDIQAICSVPEEVNFVYETSTDYTVALGEILTSSHKNEFDKISNLYSDFFFPKVLELLDKHFSDKGNAQIHRFHDHEIEPYALKLTNNKPTISLDPSVRHGDNIFSFRSSRYFDIGGKEYRGQYPHHSDPLFAKQVGDLKARFPGYNGSFTLLDDDTYSGSTLKTMIGYLEEHNVKVDNIVVGIKVGNKSPAKSVVEYQLEGGGDPTSKVDIGDCRDLLIGSSGLVVDIGGGQIGRAPYILPFISPHDRMGMSLESELLFSKDVLLLNKDFYSQVENIIGRSVLISDIGAESALYLCKYFDCDIGTSIQKVIDLSLSGI